MCEHILLIARSFVALPLHLFYHHHPATHSTACPAKPPAPPLYDYVYSIRETLIFCVCATKYRFCAWFYAFHNPPDMFQLGWAGSVNDYESRQEGLTAGCVPSVSGSSLLHGLTWRPFETFLLARKKILSNSEKRDKDKNFHSKKCITIKNQITTKTGKCVTH